MALTLCGCSQAGAQNAERKQATSHSTETTSNNMIQINTELGNIVVKLYDETPKHRDNMLKLVDEGYYQDLLFHRVIKEFMIQGGDPDSKGAPAGKQLGAGDVGYTVPAEFNPKFFHKKGALCAARKGDQVNPEKASSGCQFYLVQGKTYTEQELNQMEAGMVNQAKQKRFYELAGQRRAQIQQMQQNQDSIGLKHLQEELINQLEAEFAQQGPRLSAEARKAYSTIGGTPFLDGEYTVFGEVVEGLDVIDKIAAVECGTADRPVKDIKFSITRVNP
ncbi:MAG: peptidylprolyl isomerase [Paludibacteraceae bacterium]|nr:peptidylprolyl isomerase [Paludibacteraceae bacterium]